MTIVLEAVSLRLAPEKSAHMALVFDADSSEGGRLMREDLERERREHRVQVGGVLVPWVEADEGLRYLGYWVDLLGD